MAGNSGMRPVKRFITTHDANGKTTFDTSIPEEAPFKVLPDGAEFALCYATNGFPVQLNDGKDLATYDHYTKNLPGVTISTGTVLRVVNIRPGSTAPMHRTVSLDYGVVIEGEIELILDSGAKRLMQRGDMSVQRGTNHTWRNTSDTEWARMLYVLQPAEPVVLAGGQVLTEDTHSIPGVRSST
ncbi:hypothetical protein Sste5346_003912 [Sporothrix stenoceras]|uniref:Cupin type-2 domain-containing protein n=1 Tax=Sporothrix stenoceras TaxID=5173 RepID=A0ABR3ZAD0_9PEZI